MENRNQKNNSKPSPILQSNIWLHECEWLIIIVVYVRLNCTLYNVDSICICVCSSDMSTSYNYNLVTILGDLHARLGQHVSIACSTYECVYIKTTCGS